MILRRWGRVQNTTKKEELEEQTKQTNNAELGDEEVESGQLDESGKLQGAGNKEKWRRAKLESSLLVHTQASRAKSYRKQGSSVFEPSPFYKNVHCVIGLSHALQKHREQHGINAAEHNNDHLEEPPTESVEPGRVVSGDDGSLFEKGKILRCSDDQVAGSSSSKQMSDDAHLCFKAAKRVMALCKAAEKDPFKMASDLARQEREKVTLARRMRSIGVRRV